MSEWLDVQTIDVSVTVVNSAIDSAPRSDAGLYLCDENNDFLLDQNNQKIQVGVSVYA